MLNNEFPPLGGGTGTANHALLSRFGQCPNLQIDLITSALGTSTEYERFAEQVSIIKVPIHNRNIHHSSNRELLTYAAHALPLALKLRGARHYDFCFAWSAVPAGAVAWALRWLTGLPYIVRVCGPDIPGFERRYGLIYPLLTPPIRATWRGAARVVAKCAGEEAMIHAVDHRVVVSKISNGVDLDAFRPGGVIPDIGTLRLICVARLIERKGQHHLIEAVSRLADLGVDVTLDLIGDGDAWAANEALAHALGIGARIRFCGYVPRDQIAAHYSAAHIFVLPSYNEGMSIATLEAMAAGLPVVITRTGGTAELVQDGVNGLTFNWADVDTLVTHLRGLSADRALARRMGVASRARAAQFTWDAAAERYLEMFDQMVGRPAIRPDQPALRCSRDRFNQG
jgi:glycosyltransferase involved in cell wall biosynthesis